MLSTLYHRFKTFYRRLNFYQINTTKKIEILENYIDQNLAGIVLNHLKLVLA